MIRGSGREPRQPFVTGAEALLETLIGNGVTTCFANPGTSEMPFVSALDKPPRIRPILCLFEGVATGAADGYGRIAGAPACTLLHLGPGYANGIANLHNARRAYTPIVNVVGDQATFHLDSDAPLTSDIKGLATPNSVWVQSAGSAAEIPRLAAEAVAHSISPPGGPATLIVPADTAWSEIDWVPVAPQKISSPPPSRGDVQAAASAVRAAKNPAILLGGHACGAAELKLASRLAASGVRIFADTFIARQVRGAGHFAPERLPYFAEQAAAVLADIDLLLLAGTRAPVAFFAYPDRPNALLPHTCDVQILADNGQDAAAALRDLADAVNARTDGGVEPLKIAALAPGRLGLRSTAEAIARHLPEGAIICDDAATSSGPVWAATATAAAHDWLALTGGAIGAAIPMALGAAIAAPDRKVVALTGDGAAAYTVQGLWSLAREQADVTVIVFANRRYRILDIELGRISGAAAGAAANSLLDLENPVINWAGLSQSLGVSAVRCSTSEAFDDAFASAMAGRSPALIEVQL